MTDVVQLAKAAREQLAGALNALQNSTNVPDQLMEVADPIAEAMSVFHRIERSQGTQLEGRVEALANVRRALDSLQGIEAIHPAVDLVMEAVAASLSKAHALSRYQPPAAAPAPVAAAPAPVPTSPPAAVIARPPAGAAPTPIPQPAPPQPVAVAAPPPQPIAAAPMLVPVANPMPAAYAPAAGHGAPAPAPAAYPAAHPLAAPLPSPYAAPAPAASPYGAQASAPVTAPVGAPPAASPYGARASAASYGAPASAAPHGAPASAASYGGAPASAAPHGAPASAASYGAPASAAYRTQPAATSAAAYTPPVAYSSPAQASYGAPRPESYHPPVPSAAEAYQPSAVSASDGYRAPPPSAPSLAERAGGAGSVQAASTIVVELGTRSTSNFYKGLAGNDVVEHGGVFVATYKIPVIGSTVMLHVLLPGNYEFHASALVQWVREPRSDNTEPGFGARFVDITSDGRQLVYRYARNREPLFYDDL